jgi:hypothetical protein
MLLSEYRQTVRDALVQTSSDLTLDDSVIDEIAAYYHGRENENGPHEPFDSSHIGLMYRYIVSNRAKLASAALRPEKSFLVRCQTNWIDSDLLEGIAIPQAIRNAFRSGAVQIVSIDPIPCTRFHEDGGDE